MLKMKSCHKILADCIEQENVWLFLIMKKSRKSMEMVLKLIKFYCDWSHIEKTGTEKNMYLLAPHVINCEWIFNILRGRGKQ